MESILVMGSTGNVGHTLVGLLSGAGIQVRAATRHPDKVPRLPGVQPVYVELDQRQSWGPALQGVSRVFFMAKNADAEPEKTLIPFVDAMKASGVKHGVLMTALGVDQAEGLGLNTVEKYLAGSGLPYTILRPNWFMQNFSSGFIAPMIAGMNGVYLPAADSTTSLIDTRDIAAVAAKVLTSQAHYGQGYALTGPQALSYGQATEVISRFADRSISYTAIPEEAFRQSLRDAGWYEGQIALMSNLFAGVRQGWNSAVLPTVEQILGRQPNTFEQFVQDHAAVWRRA